MTVTKVQAYAAQSATSALAPFGIARREPGEMLDFCATHRIVSDIELIPMQRINEAWARMLKQDVRYRFVIDMASLKS